MLSCSWEQIDEVCVCVCVFANPGSLAAVQQFKANSLLHPSFLPYWAYGFPQGLQVSVWNGQVIWVLAQITEPDYSHCVLFLDAPWFSEECQEMKWQNRCLEYHWRKMNNEFDQNHIRDYVVTIRIAKHIFLPLCICSQTYQRPYLK